MNSPTTQHTSLEQTLKAQERLIQDRGVKLYCPHCQEPNASIALELICPTEFFCRECDNEFDMTHIRDVINGAEKWKRLIGWLTTFPEFRPEVSGEAEDQQ